MVRRTPSSPQHWHLELQLDRVIIHQTRLVTPMHQIQNGKFRTKQFCQLFHCSHFPCLPPPSPSSIKSLTSFQGPLQILHPHPLCLISASEFVPYLCFFPLKTLAGFFHCFFPNSINCTHSSSSFSNLSMSDLFFFSLTPTQNQAKKSGWHTPH